MTKARDLARLSPNTSGQLPDSNLLALAASKLTGQVPDANAPGGSVIQVVQASNTGATSTTSTSFIATSHSVTITPSSTSSRILLMHQGMTNQLSVNNWSWATIYRNASVNLYAGGGAGESAGGGYTNGSSDSHCPITLVTLDSPNTTSATTYTVYFKGTGNTVRYNSDGWKLYFVAMEIAG